MSSDIRVRAYNVGYGDCFLVSFPDGGKRRHMLIDFGSAPSPSGNQSCFQAVAENIHEETEGHIDVVVMTHDHRDHMNGFRSLQDIFKNGEDNRWVDNVWMGLPSMPEYPNAYYEEYFHGSPDLIRKVGDLNSLRHELKTYRDTVKSRGTKLAPSMQTLIDNNIPDEAELDFVRGLAKDPGKVQYLYCGSKVRGPFSSQVKVRVLAPLEEMTPYFSDSYDWSYLELVRNVLGSVGEIDNKRTKAWPRASDRKSMLDAPQNLMPADWTKLKAAVMDNSPEAVYVIDSFANNMSLVFTLEVCGKRLLFAGDAGAESWAWIKDSDDFRGKTPPIGPVDFLKVPNHGSGNGIPDELLDRLLPKKRKDKATAIVSTRSDVYGAEEPIPARKMLRSLDERCTLRSTSGSEPWVEVHL